MKLTEAEMHQLRYAERNHGRNFVTALSDEPCNTIIHRLTDQGLFVDGGPSSSGRWRILTPAGRAALSAENGRGIKP
jgi:hypothetical protein